MTEGLRRERPVWPRLTAFVALSLLVHALLSQMSWQPELPVFKRTERLIVSLTAPAEPPPATPSRPEPPRRKPAAPAAAPPALGAPAEAVPAVATPAEPDALAGSPEGVEEGVGDAGEMADLVKRIQQRAAPDPAAPATSRATPRHESNPRPQYPALARVNHWQGVVQLQVWVSDEGRVERIQLAASSGHDLLDDAAINAVRYWRFVPARRGDAPVADVVAVSIPFPAKK